NIAGAGAAFVAHGILAGDGAGAGVGDDLHVRVGVGRQARLGRDLVVAPDAQPAPARRLGSLEVGEGEVVFGVPPAVVGAAEGAERANVDHDGSPNGRSLRRAVWKPYR